MNEDGGGSEGGKDVSLDDLFGEDPDANVRRSVEAEGNHDDVEPGMEKIILSEDEEEANFEEEGIPLEGEKILADVDEGEPAEPCEECAEGSKSTCDD